MCRSLHTPTAFVREPFFPHNVCLFNRMISKIPMQLGSSNLTYKCSTMSTVNPFILESKDQWSTSRVTNTLPAWVFALLWVLDSSSFHCFPVMGPRCTQSWLPVHLTAYILHSLLYISVHFTTKKQQLICCSITINTSVLKHIKFVSVGSNMY